MTGKQYNCYTPVGRIFSQVFPNIFCRYYIVIQYSIKVCMISIYELSSVMKLDSSYPKTDFEKYGDLNEKTTLIIGCNKG